MKESNLFAGSFSELETAMACSRELNKKGYKTIITKREVYVVYTDKEIEF